MTNKPTEAWSLIEHVERYGQQQFELGRQAGLEEAAQIFDDNIAYLESIKRTAYGEGNLETSKAAQEAIRALKATAKDKP